MSRGKAFFTTGVVAIIIIFLTMGTVHAQPDMSKWLGKWFSFNVSQKGIAFDGSNFKQGSDKGSGYFQIRDWDSIDGVFYVDVYSLNNKVWEAKSKPLLFYAGTDLKFFFLVNDESDTSIKFVALMEGKEKNGVLKSANIKTLGGLVLKADNDDNSYGAGAIDFKGKMVDFSKVKVPSDVIIGGGGGATGTHYASGTYTYNSQTGIFTMNTTNSDFVDCGPKAGSIQQFTVTSLTETTTTWYVGTEGEHITLTRQSGTTGDIVGTWTGTGPNDKSNTYTVTLNSNNTFSMVANIVGC